MFRALFGERLAKMDCFDEAGTADGELENMLAQAIHAALSENGLVAPFMEADTAVVPRQLSETTSTAWSHAAASVYLSCGGASLSASQLFEIIELIARLRMEPFGAVFAAALVEMASHDGWPAVLSEAAGVPVEVSSEALQSWEASELTSPESTRLLKAALDSELAYTEPGDLFALDSTHDHTFVQPPQ